MSLSPFISFQSQFVTYLLTFSHICGIRLQVLTVIFLSVTPCACTDVLRGLLSASQGGEFETNRAWKELFMSLLTL